MICANELSTQNCHSRAILYKPLASGFLCRMQLHIAEELWSLLGIQVPLQRYLPSFFGSKHLVESEKEYPVSSNRCFNMVFTFGF
jgi:leucyl-tRNA synthetase